MQKKDNAKPSMNKDERKRGRPAGKNRVPLSLEERRARNAQYERERRNETADAMTQLAEAARCDPQITNPDLLATVISRLQSAKSEKSIEDLRRINDDLETQIADLERRLGEEPCAEENVGNRSERQTSSQSESDTDRSVEGRRPTKFRKTSKRSKVHHGARPTSVSSHESSSDTQDSNWSHHHLGKTLPQPFPEHSLQKKNEHSSDRSSPHIERAESMSSQFQGSFSDGDEEVNSEISNQPEVLYEESQQKVEVEYQFLPEKSQIKSVDSPEDKSIDLFTDQEKAVLAKLGWSDFIELQDVYNENQSRWPHVDYNGF